MTLIVACEKSFFTMGFSTKDTKAAQRTQSYTLTSLCVLCAAFVSFVLKKCRFEPLKYVYENQLFHQFFHLPRPCLPA
jgi:hypothetical protein